MKRLASSVVVFTSGISYMKQYLHSIFHLHHAYRLIWCF